MDVRAELKQVKDRTHELEQRLGAMGATVDTAVNDITQLKTVNLENWQVSPATKVRLRVVCSWHQCMFIYPDDRKFCGTSPVSAFSRP